MSTDIINIIDKCERKYPYCYTTMYRDSGLNL